MAAGDPVCTDEMLTALKGAFPFADSDTNSGTAPEMYLAASEPQMALKMDGETRFVLISIVFVECF